MAPSASSGAAEGDEVQDREDRLTAIINVLGHPSLASLEDFIFLHGSNFKLVPSAPQNPSQDTQTQFQPALADSLQQTNFALVEKTRARKRDLKRVTAELERVKAQVGFLEGEKRKEVERREEAERDWRRAEELNRDLVAERERGWVEGAVAAEDRAASQAARADEELAQLNWELDRVREELSASASARAELDQELPPLRAEADQLRATNSTLTAQLADKDGAISQLTDHANAVQDDIARAQEVQAEYEAVLQRLEDLEDHLSRVDSDLRSESTRRVQAEEREAVEREGRRVAERDNARLRARLGEEGPVGSPLSSRPLGLISSAQRASPRLGSPALPSQLAAAAASPLGRALMPLRPTLMQRDASTSGASAASAPSPTASRFPLRSARAASVSRKPDPILERDFAPSLATSQDKAAPGSMPTPSASSTAPPAPSLASADRTPRPTPTAAHPDLATQRSQYPKLLEAYQAQLVELERLRGWVDRKKPDIHLRTKADRLALLPGPPLPPRPPLLAASDLPVFPAFEDVEDMSRVYPELERAHERVRRNAQEQADWKALLHRALERLKEKDAAEGYSTADSGVGREGGLVKGRKRKVGTGRKSVGGVGLAFAGNNSGPGSMLGRSSSFDGSSAVEGVRSSPVPLSPRKSPRKSMLASVLATASATSPAQPAITSTAVGSQESARSALLPGPSPTARLAGPSPIVRGDAGSRPPSQTKSKSSQVESGTKLPMTPSRKAKRKSDVLELATAPPPSSRPRTQRVASSQDPPPRLVGRVSSGRLTTASEGADSDATEPLPQSSLPEPDTQPDSPALGPTQPEASGSSTVPPEPEPVLLVPPTPTARPRAARTDENQSPPGRHRQPRPSQSSSVKSDRTVRRAPLRERDVQTAQLASSRAQSPSPLRVRATARPASQVRTLMPSSSPGMVPPMPSVSQKRLPRAAEPADDDEEGADEWRGVPFSPPKPGGRTQRFMDEAPPTSMLARYAADEFGEPGKPTSPANEELRYFAAGAGPVRARSSSLSPLPAVRRSPTKKVAESPLSSPRKPKVKRVRGVEDGEEELEGEGEQDSSDRRRVRANRRKRRRSEKGAEGEEGETQVVVKEEERDSGYEEAKPPARRRVNTAAQPSPAATTSASARKPGKYDRPLKNSPATLKASATASTSARRTELNPDRHQGETAAFKEVVRNKEQRQQMFASACEECASYYARTTRTPPAGPCGHTKGKAKGNTFLDDRHEKEQARMQQISRHRDNARPEQEPVDYWKLGMPPTQEVERINEQAREQRESNRRFQEAEAEKQNGLYRFKK